MSGRLVGDRDAYPYLDGFKSSHAVLRALAEVAGVRLTDAAEANRYGADAEEHEREALVKLERLWASPRPAEAEAVERCARRLATPGERLFWGDHEIEAEVSK